MKKFELGRRALRDLQEVWEFVSKDSFAVADHLLEQFYEAFEKLAAIPGIGHRRPDLTYETYYSGQLDSRPLRIARILHAKRDVKRLLGNR